MMENWKGLRALCLSYWAEILSKLLALANDDSNPESLKAHQLAVELMPQVCHVLDALAEEGEKKIGCLCRLLDAAKNHYRYYLSSRDTLKRLTEHPILKDMPIYRGIAYAHLGDLLGMLGDRNGSKAALEQAEAQFRKAGNDRGLAYTFLTKAQLLRTMEDYAGAGTALDQAEMLYRKLGSNHGLANVFRNRGVLLALQNGYKGDEFVEAEKRYRDMKDKLGLANTLCTRGMLLAVQREYDKALKLMGEAYPLYLELCDLSGQARCLQVQYQCLMKTDRTREAKKLRPLLEALIPELPPPDQKMIRRTLAHIPIRAGGQIVRIKIK